VRDDLVSTPPATLSVALGVTIETVPVASVQSRAVAAGQTGYSLPSSGSDGATGAIMAICFSIGAIALLLAVVFLVYQRRSRLARGGMEYASQILPEDSAKAGVTRPKGEEGVVATRL
jgi:hypothetical protein